MQTRPYDDKAGQKCWLSRTERTALLEHYRDDKPRRHLALALGLHGLRSGEVVDVHRQHFRRVHGADSDAYKLVIPEGKGGRTRETPVSPDVRDKAVAIASVAELRQDESLVDVTAKSLRDWIGEATDELADEFENPDWHDVGMHDLRRTWATDTFYTLAFEGVPIAEELTMGWGGWAMTSTGRETFRNNYLGPEPDHVAADAMQLLAD